MSARYDVLAGEHRQELVELKSRFLACVAPVDDEDAARAWLDGLRAEFPDASHHCWAYAIGPPGSTARVGMSDDGEPHGSAGRPMLDVLLHAGLGDVAAVVVRWFGGTKLGRGGLVRAYGGAVSAALGSAARTPKIDWLHVTLTLDYAAVRDVAHLYAAHEVERLDERFGEHVEHDLRLPRERRAGFDAALRQASGGQLGVDDPDG